MKYLFTSLLCLLFSVSFSQLKVDPYGRVGVGTIWPNPGYKLHVAGNLLCSNYPANPSYELRFKLLSSTPGVEIGSSSDIVSFWSEWIYYHELRASEYFRMSDSTLKSNIKPINNSLNKILQIKPVFYSIEDNKISMDGRDSISLVKNQYGFLSQQIKNVLPEASVTREDKNGMLLMDYDQIIPLTVGAIQEQQKIIDSLKTQIEELTKQFQIANNAFVVSKNYLFQNNPNPFSEITQIKYKIDQIDFVSGEIYIFNMNGQFVKKYKISKPGDDFITIEKFELNPGVYLYTLLVNNQEIDTKRMIVLE